MNTPIYQSRNKVRVVTATSLFDGHDASINVIRRILQSSGAEVIHLGHNRSVHEIVTAAVQEDAQAIAVSSYQGGHLEFFKYIIDMLQQRGAPQVKVFGGGGGVIVPAEAAELEAYGVAKIYSPEDGRRLGLQGIINDLLAQADFSLTGDGYLPQLAQELTPANHPLIARLITAAEAGCLNLTSFGARLAEIRGQKAPGQFAPVIGLTGTGGSGKSSIVDELVLRFLRDHRESRAAILSVDPSKKKTGGALLGDRIRMNSIYDERVYMRSLATRQSGFELSGAINDAIAVCRLAGFDLIIVETSGIGQAGAAITDIADLSLYVMTPEYGAATQLEKIDMIDFADLIAVNKFERQGALDAIREVRKQYRRSRNLFEGPPDQELPVFGTIASQFNDPGINSLYLELLGRISKLTGRDYRARLELPARRESIKQAVIIPPDRTRYLSDVARTVRAYRQHVAEQAALARRWQQLRSSAEHLRQAGGGAGTIQELEREAQAAAAKLTPECRELLEKWPAFRRCYREPKLTYQVRDNNFTVDLYQTTLAGTRVPKVLVPDLYDWGDILHYQLLENVPGGFPYTAGVFPFKRTDEEPRRQFAGEGPPERTNKRFHYLCRQDKAKRLSTAFDSATLYGDDPDERPDIYGKIGESGVSICTLEDLKKLYAGFDYTDFNTSVSMTINGPAPIMLAFYLNAAIDHEVDKFTAEKGRAPTPEEFAKIRAATLSTVRGTVQADILKEDQAQNTCIFNIEFALKMMGDIQEYFVQHDVRNYYSVSISGYHIAEAGANPISQVAFTLANGFTYVEYYLARGMPLDSFAPNLSFFFSNGMDAEYSVIGRVARRIWAVALRNLYHGNERSQKLKYHIQTSGRSLHSQEVDFNDIRTTLQALMAIYDNCNSLHTNSYDEAVTTPTEESVRRAVAIQLIVNREYGLLKNENGLQGSYLTGELTSLVEEAVLGEFERIADRGGVLGAMEKQYQRGKIQEESLHYEMLKHSGELPLIGVNTFINPNLKVEEAVGAMQLTRATPEEKWQQINNLRAFQKKNEKECAAALRQLQQVAIQGGNIFAELMSTARVASLGQITRTLYEVGGQYRRSM